MKTHEWKPSSGGRKRGVIENLAFSTLEFSAVYVQRFSLPRFQSPQARVVQKMELAGNLGSVEKFCAEINCQNFTHYFRKFQPGANDNKCPALPAYSAPLHGELCFKAEARELLIIEKNKWWNERSLLFPYDVVGHNLFTIFHLKICRIPLEHNYFHTRWQEEIVVNALIYA